MPPNKYYRGHFVMAKTAITIIASEETFKNLSTFKEIEELNHTVRTQLERHTDDLTKSAINVLKLLQRYSCKYLGVSFMRKNTIASLLGISRRTVIRACNLLEELKIIKQYEMRRDTDNLQTSNAIVIQPIEDEVFVTEMVEQSTKTDCKTTNDTQDCQNLSHQKDNFSFKTNTNSNHLNTRASQKRRQYIKFVPKSLQHMQAFFSKGVKDIYSRCWLAVKKLNIGDYVEQSDIQQIGHVVFNQLKEYLRNGQAQTLEEQCRVAYTIAYNQLTETFDIKAIRQDQYKHRSLPFYNWLDETGESDNPLAYDWLNN